MVNIDISNVMAYFFTPKKVGNLSFDAKLGLGYNIYNSVRKNLFSDTYIYSFGYQDEGANSLGSDYGTIKKGIFSAPAETVYIYGLLAKYKLNSRLNLLLDYTVRSGRTDKWDSSIMNTQNLSDKVNLLSVGIAYKFGNHDYNNEWESPIDGLKDDVTTLFVKIDGFTDDADNDGVSDAFDKSPNTPLGVAVDGSGNALDVDMDNVPDYRDADPFSNRGAQVDENGVELDDDKDGVLDKGAFLGFCRRCQISPQLISRAEIMEIYKATHYDETQKMCLAMSSVETNSQGAENNYLSQSITTTTFIKSKPNNIYGGLGSLETKVYNYDINSKVGVRTPGRKLALELFLIVS